MRKKRDPRPYVGMHKEVIFSCPEYGKLSPVAKCLYQLMKGKRNPVKNNGLVKLSYRDILKLKQRGLRRRETISKAFKELEADGWIKREGQGGGLYRKATYYRLTGKYDEYGIK